MAMAVFWVCPVCEYYMDLGTDKKGGRVKRRAKLTNHRATMQMTFITMWPPLPRSTAYRGTNGWTLPYENKVSGSGFFFFGKVSDASSQGHHRI
jgi:hypothetical protein